MRLTIGIAGAFGVGKIFESSDLLVQTTGRDPIIITSIVGFSRERMKREG